MFTLVSALSLLLAVATQVLLFNPCGVSEPHRVDVFATAGGSDHAMVPVRLRRSLVARHFRRGLVGTSLLLCVGTVLLWGRSCFSQDLLELHRRGDARGRAYDDIRGAVSSGGSLGAGYVRISHPNRPSIIAGWAFAAARPDEGWWPLRFDVLGFRYWSLTLPASRKNGEVHVAGFAVPHALLAVLLAVPPALAARRYVLARRPTGSNAREPAAGAERAARIVTGG